MSDVTGQWNLHWTDQQIFAGIKRWTRWLESTPMLLAPLTIWIGLVSAYDIYLTIKYAESLLYLEQNPVARHILNLNSPEGMAVEHLARFIGLKCGGTVVSIGSLFVLGCWRLHYANLAATGVALVQLGVLLFLSVG
ncbi:MAG: hypothetical protein R3C05_19575 [Pirellulaceae bacterium]